MPVRARKETYHHGDLGPALREAARAILDEEGLSAMSLRSVARRAGVSHAAPYRHYASLEALLADVATAGFAELRALLRHAAATPGHMASTSEAVGHQRMASSSEAVGHQRMTSSSEAIGHLGNPDRIGRIAAAYMRFAATHGGVLRLMLGSEFPNRGEFAALRSAADGIGEEIGTALGDPALGLAVWAAAHGLAMLTLENVIDLGQRDGGLQVLPSRAEILMRSLFAERE